MDLKIFVNTDDDVRLARRLKRDIKERGRHIPDVLAQYNKHVKRSYDEFIRPTMKYADIVIPQGKSNITGIYIILGEINYRLKDLGYSPSPIFAKPSYVSSPGEISEIKGKNIPGLVACMDDKEILNEIASKFFYKQETFFNKYFLYFDNI